MKIYVASSWRNKYQQEVVQVLRDLGHDIYDFRNPEPGNTGFKWSEIDENWQSWSATEFRKNLQHDIASDGFANDYIAMTKADACVLVLPAGRSAHLEAGWFTGKNLKTVIFMPEQQEPELMYKLCNNICTTMDELKNEFNKLTLYRELNNRINFLGKQFKFKKQVLLENDVEIPYNSACLACRMAAIDWLTRHFGSSANYCATDGPHGGWINININTDMAANTYDDMDLAVIDTFKTVIV